MESRNSTFHSVLALEMRNMALNLHDIDDVSRLITYLKSGDIDLFYTYPELINYSKEDMFEYSREEKVKTLEDLHDILSEIEDVIRNKKSLYDKKVPTLTEEEKNLFIPSEGCDNVYRLMYLERAFNLNLDVGLGTLLLMERKRLEKIIDEIVWSLGLKPRLRYGFTSYEYSKILKRLEGYKNTPELKNVLTILSSTFSSGYTRANDNKEKGEFEALLYILEPVYENYSKFNGQINWYKFIRIV